MTRNAVLICVNKSPIGDLCSNLLFLYNNPPPPCFHWNSILDTMKKLYFFWSNIVWSKNKIRTTYVIRNVYLNLSFLYFLLWLRDTGVSISVELSVGSCTLFPLRGWLVKPFHLPDTSKNEEGVWQDRMKQYNSYLFFHKFHQILFFVSSPETKIKDVI